jgi:membrane protein required for colicin V production
MTAFDYAVLAVIAASVLLGLWRGVVSEVLALAAWVVAFLVARAVARKWRPGWRDRIAEPGVRLAAAYVLVFCRCPAGFALARLLISLMLKAVGWVCWIACWAGRFGVCADFWWWWRRCWWRG